mgnify:FL=1
MYNLKKNTYVVVEFTEINGHFSGIYDSRTKQDLSFASSPIVEIAAVKIQKGEISEHYTNFIGLDGVQAKNLCEEMSSLTDKGITPTHLIGAPSLEETVRKLYDFTRDCIILVQYKTPFFNTPFDTFQLYARSFGYVFNNPVFGILDIVQAAKLKKAFKEKDIDYRDVLRVAENIEQMIAGWQDIFAEYEIFFAPFSNDPCNRGRNDPLSWAIAFARLFLAITDCEKRRC